MFLLSSGFPSAPCGSITGGKNLYLFGSLDGRRKLIRSGDLRPARSLTLSLFSGQVCLSSHLLAKTTQQPEKRLGRFCHLFFSSQARWPCRKEEEEEGRTALMRLQKGKKERRQKDFCPFFLSFPGTPSLLLPKLPHFKMVAPASAEGGRKELS